MSDTVAPERGCGTRKAGGVYLETPNSPYGTPHEAFWMDPPVPVDAAALSLSAKGVTLIQNPVTGAWDVWDIIGSKYYPNVLDFLLEAQRYGISRRVSKGLDFGKLSEESRLVLLHPRGHVENWREVYAPGWDAACPREAAGLTPPPFHTKDVPPVSRPTLCCGVWYEDIEGGEPVVDGDFTKRTFPPQAEPAKQWGYLGRPHKPEADYRLAIVAAYPIRNIAVIRDAEGGTHEQGLGHAGQAKLPVTLKDN